MKKYIWEKASTMVTAFVLATTLAGCAVPAPTAQSAPPSAALEAASEAEETADAAVETETGYEPVDIAIGVDSSSFSAQLRIAEEAGIFEKYNINADLTTFSFGIDTINGVILGEVQVGEANDYAVATRAAQGSNLRLVTSILGGQGDSKSLYANSEDIQSGEDLAGKNLSVQSGTVNEYEWAKTLQTYGLTNEDVNFLEFSSDAEAIAAFQSKNADAIWLSKQFKDAAGEVENSHTIANLADVGGKNIAYLVADEAFLAGNEEAVERLILALNDATELINNDIDQAAEYLSANLGIAFDDAKAGLTTYDYEIRFNQSDVDHVLEVADTAIELGLIENAYDLSQYVVTDAVKAVYPDRVDF